MLERYRDGEPVPELHNAIEAHLRVCDGCRGEFLRLQREPPSTVRETSPEPETAGLLSLLSVIRNWQSGLPEPVVLGPAIRQRVAQEIGLYLGGCAASEIVQPVNDDAGNLLPAIQPYLGRFLGQKAASHLSSHIIEVAVVRR
jgi:hypothetical protein